MHPITFRAFARAIFSSWFAAMSGSLSVPAAALGVYGPNTWVQLGFAITAFVCVWAAAYSVWARERAARNEAEAKLQHPHGLSFQFSAAFDSLNQANTLEIRVYVHNETNIPLE